MKKYAAILASIVLISIQFSCNNNPGNMQVMTQMKDSIFAAYPTVASVLINVQDDKHLIVTLGSEDLFATNENRRQQIANEMGAMAMRLFGADNNLEEAKILVTNNEANQEPEPANAVSCSVPLHRK